MTPPCVECKHCKEQVLDDYFMPSLDYLCKKKRSKPSVIDGHSGYLKCSFVRAGQEYCSMFEQRIGIIQRILNWFRRKKWN